MAALMLQESLIFKQPLPSLLQNSPPPFLGSSFKILVLPYRPDQGGWQQVDVSCQNQLDSVFPFGNPQLFPPGGLVLS